MIASLIATSLFFAQRDLPPVFVDEKPKTYGSVYPPRAFVKMPDSNITNDPNIESVRRQLIVRLNDLNHSFEKSNMKAAQFAESADSLRSSSLGAGGYSYYNIKGWGYHYSAQYMYPNYAAALGNSTAGSSYRYRRLARVLGHQINVLTKSVRDINTQTGRSPYDMSF